MRIAYKLIDGEWEEVSGNDEADVVRNGDIWTLRNPSVMPNLFFTAKTRATFKVRLEEYEARYGRCELFHRAMELI